MKPIVLLGCFVAAALLVSQPAPREQVGPLPGGGFLLNSGWRIHPAGKQIQLDTFPMASVISVDKKYLLVLNGGYKPPSISVIDIAAGREMSRKGVPDGWLGLALSRDGKSVYVASFSSAGIAVFARERR